MLLVLTGVTAVSVALLAYVNELTKGPIAEANAKTLNEALKKVLPEYTNNPVAESDTVFSEKDGKKIVDFIIYPAKNGEKWVGSAVEAKSMGFGGELKVLVGFDAEGKIYNYSLLAHAETPGLGSKADKWFGAYDPAKNEKPVSHEESAKSILGMNPGETPLAVTKDMNIRHIKAVRWIRIPELPRKMNRLLRRKVKQLLMTLITKKGGDSYE